MLEIVGRFTHGPLRTLCPDDAGHLLSVGPLGVELMRRGGRVTMVSGKKAIAIARQLDLPLYELDADGVRRRLSGPMWLAFSLAGSGWMIALRNWFRWRAEVALQLLPSALEDLKVDGVVIDHTIVAAGSVTEWLGLPVVTFCSGTLWREEERGAAGVHPFSVRRRSRALRRNRWAYAGWHWFMRPTLRASIAAGRLGVLPLSAGSTIRSRRWLRSRSYVPNLIFPAASFRPFSITSDRWPATAKSLSMSSFPWDWLDGRPLVFASLGSMAGAGDLPVLRKIIAACAAWTLSSCSAWGSGTTEKPHCENGWAQRRKMCLQWTSPPVGVAGKSTPAGHPRGPEHCVGRPLPRRAHGGPAPAGRHARVGSPDRTVRRGAANVGPRLAEQMRQLIDRVLTEDSFRQRAKAIQQAMIAAGGVRPRGGDRGGGVDHGPSRPGPLTWHRNSSRCVLYIHAAKCDRPGNYLKSDQEQASATELHRVLPQSNLEKASDWAANTLTEVSHEQDQ